MGGYDHEIHALQAPRSNRAGSLSSALGTARLSEHSIAQHSRARYRPAVATQRLRYLVGPAESFKSARPTVS